MIGKLKGIIDDIASDYVILDVNGVGYKIFVSSKTIHQLPQDQSLVAFLIDMQIREDDISLYGFTSASEKEWFTKLISVKGISPRIALIILSSLTVNQIISAIIAGEKRAFYDISGVGKKLSERIITELKDTKNISENLSIAPPDAIDFTKNEQLVSNILNDAVSALSNLGYNRTNAYNICQSLIGAYPDISVGNLIKMALKEFSK